LMLAAASIRRGWQAPALFNLAGGRAAGMREV